MSEALVPAAAATAAVTARGAAGFTLPQVIVDAGPGMRSQGFWSSSRRGSTNARTRAAYGRAVGQFLGWCEARGLGLREVSPLHVAAYIRTHLGSAPTVKQHLPAIRMLGDWLVVNQVLPVNPAARRSGGRSTSSPRARRRSSRRPRRGSSSRRSTRAPWPGSGTGHSSPSCSTASRG